MNNISKNSNNTSERVLSDIYHIISLIHENKNSMNLIYTMLSLNVCHHIYIKYTKHIENLKNNHKYFNALILLIT